MWNFVPLEEDNFSLGSLLSTLLLCHRLFLLGFLSHKEVKGMGNGVAEAGGAGQELVTNGWLYTSVRKCPHLRED